MYAPFRPLAEMTPTERLDELTRLLARGTVRLYRRSLKPMSVELASVPPHMDFTPENDLRTVPE